MFMSQNTWVVTHKESGLMCLCEVTFARKDSASKPPDGYSDAMVVATREDGHMMGMWIEKPGYGAVQTLKASRSIADSDEKYWEAKQ